MLVKLLPEKVKFACVLIAEFFGWLSFVDHEIVDKYINEKKNQYGHIALIISEPFASLIYVLSLFSRSRLIKTLRYAKEAGLTFGDLAGALGMSRYRLFWYLLSVQGYSPSIQAWLTKTLGMPDSELRPPFLFAFRNFYRGFLRILLRSGLSSWILRKRQLRILRKRARILRNSVIALQKKADPAVDPVIELLTAQLDQIYAELEHIAKQHTRSSKDMD